MDKNLLTMVALDGIQDITWHYLKESLTNKWNPTPATKGKMTLATYMRNITHSDPQMATNTSDTDNRNNAHGNVTLG